MFRVDGIEDKGTMHGVQVQLVMGELKTELGMLIQENEVTLDEEQLLFIAADDCDAFDSDVDEAPTAQTMFMVNLSSADLVYDEAGPSYDSDILFEKKDVFQYRRFTKLIIADLVKKFPSIPPRLKEDYHSVKDDILFEFLYYKECDNTRDANFRCILEDMERKFVTTDEFWKVHGKFDQVLYEIVPQLAERATNDLIEGNLKELWSTPSFKRMMNFTQEDDAPPEEEKRVERYKTSKFSKSARGSSSKRSAKESISYVMVISVILVSSDSSKDSVGTPDGRVILFETPIIAPTIPPSPDYTPASPDYSPASKTESDPSEDPSSGHIPPLPAVLSFLSLDDDTTDSDTPDTPPSPTHGTPFTEITASTQRSPVIPHHSSLDLPSTSAGPSRKRRRSPMTSVPILPPVSRALSLVRADLIPSPKRVRDSGYLTDVEVGPRETRLRDDVIARGSDEPHLEQDIDPEIQAETDECFAYADALRDRRIDARVVVEAVDRDEIETGMRGLIEVRVERITHHAMPEDIPEPTQEGAVHVMYETLGDLGHRIIRVESAVTALTERVTELERDNMRLRGTASVESQRVDRLQRGMSCMQRKMRQMRRLRFYDRVRVGRLEACARKQMGYRP
nr:hypothetical protein [Tanacetum cinerariifolium]